MELVLAYEQQRPVIDLFQSVKNFSGAKGCQMQPWKLIVIAVFDDLHDQLKTVR